MLWLNPTILQTFNWEERTSHDWLLQICFQRIQHYFWTFVYHCYNLFLLAFMAFHSIPTMVGKNKGLLPQIILAKGMGKCEKAVLRREIVARASGNCCGCCGSYPRYCSRRSKRPCVYPQYLLDCNILGTVLRASSWDNFRSGLANKPFVNTRRRNLRVFLFSTATIHRCIVMIVVIFVYQCSSH